MRPRPRRRTALALAVLTRMAAPCLHHHLRRRRHITRSQHLRQARTWARPCHRGPAGMGGILGWRRRHHGRPARAARSRFPRRSWMACWRASCRDRLTACKGRVGIWLFGCPGSGCRAAVALPAAPEKRAAGQPPCACVWNACQSLSRKQCPLFVDRAQHAAAARHAQCARRGAQHCAGRQRGGYARCATEHSCLQHAVSALRILHKACSLQHAAAACRVQILIFS